MGRIRRSSGPRDCHNRRSEPESSHLSCKFKGTSQPDDGRDALSQPAFGRVPFSSDWTSLFIFRLFHAFCCDSSCEAKWKFRDFYIKEALSYIEQNFQNDISVEDISAFCGLNRSYFGKIFHDTIGRSPQEFLISYRMTKAVELLKITSLSIADIGNAVGYPNQLHFSRAFKNVYGMSPRNWRNENKLD